MPSKGSPDYHRCQNHLDLAEAIERLQEKRAIRGIGLWAGLFPTVYTLFQNSQSVP